MLRKHGSREGRISCDNLTRPTRETRVAQRTRRRANRRRRVDNEDRMKRERKRTIDCVRLFPVIIDRRLLRTLVRRNQSHNLLDTTYLIPPLTKLQKSISNVSFYFETRSCSRSSPGRARIQVDAQVCREQTPAWANGQPQNTRRTFAVHPWFESCSLSNLPLAE